MEKTIRIRFALLRQWGLLDAGDCLQEALTHANRSMVQYLRTEGLLPAVGELLAAACCVIGPDEVGMAGRRGQLTLLRWMEVEVGTAAVVARAAGQAGGQGLARAVAKSGHVELAEWLQERAGGGSGGGAGGGGCVWRVEASKAAVAAGNAALLEWLLERGCPMPVGGYFALLGSRFQVPGSWVRWA